jgi:hypothetical protein
MYTNQYDDGMRGHPPPGGELVRSVGRRGYSMSRAPNVCEDEAVGGGSGRSEPFVRAKCLPWRGASRAICVASAPKEEWKSAENEHAAPVLGALGGFNRG